MLALRFSTIQQWKDHLNTLTEWEDLNEARSLLKTGEGHRHWFKAQNKMALAFWIINQRAKTLGFYQLHNGDYRKPLSAS